MVCGVGWRNWVLSGCAHRRHVAIRLNDCARLFVVIHASSFMVQSCNFSPPSVVVGSQLTELCLIGTPLIARLLCYVAVPIYLRPHTQHCESGRWQHVIDTDKLNRSTQHRLRPPAYFTADSFCTAVSHKCGGGGLHTKRRHC